MATRIPKPANDNLTPLERWQKTAAMADSEAKPHG